MIKRLFRITKGLHWCTSLYPPYIKHYSFRNKAGELPF